MSVVIVGGNDRMVRNYHDICRQFGFDSKVFTHLKTGMQSKIGSPDLIVLFTDTMSHKMLRCTMDEAKACGSRVVHCRTSSATMLKRVLAEHTA